MPESVLRERIADGVYFTTICDSKFKTSHISVRFVMRLDEKSVSKNALSINILSSANSNYPTQAAFSRKLSALYGSILSGDVSKLGDNQVMTLSAKFIGDKYTLNGEALSNDMTQLLCDCIFSPASLNDEFDSALFAQRKQNLIDDIEAEINDKQSYAVICANRTIFRNEPYILTPSGTKELVEECSTKSVYEAYKNMLRTARVEISYIGECADDVKALFGDAFEKLDRAPMDIAYYSLSSIKSATENVCDRIDVNQSKLYMAFKSESEDRYALAYMNVIFGATPFSKLFMNVREKMSLCYYCSSSYNEAKGALCVASGVDNTNIKKAEDEIINQLEDMKNGNFSDEDMENSYKSIVNSLGMVDDYAGSLSQTYFKRILKNDITDFEQECERYRSVTKQRIMDAAASLKLDTVYVMEASNGSNN
ncbi:MAG: insulinase family protein [Oscillospiraceae bacterium]|nr:insulinase family protein [Oscillospiraceae bacterium]